MYSAPSRPGRWKQATRLLFVALAYLITAKVGLALTVAQGNATPIWAPTGIAIAALVLWGRRMWPAIAIGAFLANVATPIPVAAAAAIAAGNTLEAFIAAGLLTRARFDAGLDRVRDITAFVLLAAFVATAVSATVGTVSLFIAGSVEASQLWSNWSIWWVGDMMGALLVAPLLFAWFRPASRPVEWSGRVALEAGLLACSTVALAFLLFSEGRWALSFLMLPPLLWATLRFRQRGSTLAVFTVTVIALAPILAGNGPLQLENPTLVVGVVQALAGVTQVTLLILAATEAARIRATTSTDRLASLIEAAPAGVVVVAPEGEIMLANEAITAMLDYRGDDLIGMNVDSLVPGDDAANHEAWRGMFHAPPGVRTKGRGRQLNALKRDGTTLPVEIGLGYVRDGSRILAIAVVTDASFRLAAEAEMMRALSREHEAVERLEALDELKTVLLHTVSHDLRTPLTSIIGMAATLGRDDLPLSRADRHEFVSRIEANARKLSGLLTDLLDLERLDRGLVEPERSPSDVGAIVRGVVRDCDTTGHPLHVHADSVIASVDRAKVERIVDNLVSNAVRHTPSGTEIWVDVHAADGGVEIVIEDAGPGIPPEDKQAIFQAFEQGHDGQDVLSPGLGIGLSLVQRFTDLHGGRSWVEDRPGGGASFHVLLPDPTPQAAASRR